MKTGLWEPNPPFPSDVQILHWYQAWGQDLDQVRLNWCQQHRLIPLVTLEPWNQNLANLDLAWLRQFLQAMTWKGVIRFAHEFNGTYPWAGDPQTYVHAFQHVAQIAHRHSHHTCWCPNIAYPGSSPIMPSWPGPDAVDYIGLDGYDEHHNLTPQQLFLPTLKGMQALNKPIWITETARANADPSWITQLGQLPVEAIVWFNEQKEQPWRLTPPARAAFVSLSSTKVSSSTGSGSAT